MERCGAAGIPRKIGDGVKGILIGLSRKVSNSK